ncbi:hypothetical protein DdX_08663 [Ditylenchus destructor]|uniref:Uncharacterized protein n=1 Tax=Ditylenchus destructor TaxID=166010 RepID=A0AAD4R781_9BILA|nr:hypothetical protein DdX_08663 [Ditylenchus destructor]
MNECASSSSVASFHSANANWPKAPPPIPPPPRPHSATLPRASACACQSSSTFSNSLSTLPRQVQPQQCFHTTNAIYGCGGLRDGSCYGSSVFCRTQLRTRSSRFPSDRTRHSRPNSWPNCDFVSSNPFLRRFQMVCCCLCCPIYRCALWLCLFEVFVSVIVWYNLLDFIVKTFEVLQLKDVLLFLFLSGWLVTLFTSTGTLMMAERKKNGEYVLPRIVQQTGLLICGFLCAIMLIIYFSGGAASINNVIISVFEFIALEQPLGKTERREASDTLRYAFMLLILLDFFFICYMAFGLAVTRKYQKELERNYPITVNTASRPYQAGQFKPLSQAQPSAPPPPYA